MKKAQFDFKKQKSVAFGIVKRPVADVILFTEAEDKFGLRMLIDTGADVSMISPKIAKLIGIKIKSGEKKIFKGIGGKVEAYLHKTPIQIGELELFIPIAVPSKEVPNLLGRREALDLCNVFFLKGDSVIFEYEN